MKISKIILTEPDWLINEFEHLPRFVKSIEERMAIVLKLARLNFERDTGGPFAAAVFQKDSGKLITASVNRVVPLNCSSAHAEIMALSAAQATLGTYDLGRKGLPAHQLVVNGRPCAMCFGALLWSGIQSLVIADHDSEIEQYTGFDEGPIHPRWKEELKKRHIELISGVLNDEACKIYKDFAKDGKLVYNSRLVKKK